MLHVSKRRVRSQTDLKLNNLYSIYQFIRSHGLVSRADLAKHIGLSATSMTRLVNDLCGMGLLEEVQDLAPGSAGRPLSFLKISPDAGGCLCIDLAAGVCRVAIVNLAVDIIAYKEIGITYGITFETLSDMVAALLPEMLATANLERARLHGCGVSVAGHVMSSSGHIVASGVYGWIDNVNAKAILESRLGIPVCVENDCKAALVGEVTVIMSAESFEAAPYDNIAYIGINHDGVGCAAIVDGRLLRGSRNAACELGHVTAQLEGQICNCGHVGCFETLISEKSVIRQAKIVEPSIDSIEDIALSLRSSNRLAPLMDRLGDYIAVALNDVNCMYNPEVIILNGVILSLIPDFMDDIRKRIRIRALASIQPRLEIRKAKLGVNASLYGIGTIATEYAIEALLGKSFQKDAVQ